MLRIADIIFCLSASNAPSSGMNANGILTTITPEHIPGQFTFSVVVTFLGLDTSNPHQLSVKLFNSNEVIAEINGAMPIFKSSPPLPPEYRGLHLKMDWNKVNFRSSGIHTLTIAVDGQYLGEKSVFVASKSP